MKNGIIVGIVIVSLLGLVFVQYHYLRVGLLLERARLDQRIGYVLDEVYLKLIRQNQVQDMAMRMLVSDRTPLASPEYLLPERLKDSLNSMIREFLGADSLRMDYAFALTDDTQEKVFVATDDYVRESERQLVYQRAIGGLAMRVCDCTPFFRIHIKNTVNYLLGRLAYLIFPSVIFILLLAVCLGLLIFYLNRRRKLDEIKNDFINNLTHELKTPVFSIGMLSRMLKNAVGSGHVGKAAEYAELIEKENEVIKSHVERVLELASLEGPNYQMEKMPMAFHELLEDIVQGIQPQLQVQDGQMELKLEAVNDKVSADPVHMRNVIQNLLDNAMKYHSGSPRIEIATRNENGHIVISIADHGIGIPADQQQKVFEKFYRVPAGDLHKVKGFGLGLNYVRQIVNAHRGKISLQSRLGEGSRFEITLINEA